MFFTKYTNENTILPDRELISAVFLIAIMNTKILAIKNDRGWDIPGGHLEGDETPKEGLIREVLEEGGATFSSEKLFAIIESDNQGKYKDKVMLIYVADNFELGVFASSEDAISREVIEITEFVKRYSQSNASLDLKEMILSAQKYLKNLD